MYSEIWHCGVVDKEIVLSKPLQELWDWLFDSRTQSKFVVRGHKWQSLPSHFVWFIPFEFASATLFHEVYRMPLLRLLVKYF